MEAELGARRREHVGEAVRRERRVRIGPRPGRLERVAARLDLPAQVACDPRCPDVVLERVVVLLELVVLDGPVLDRRARGQPLRPVALDDVRAVVEVRLHEAPELTRPVHRGAA